MSRQRTEEELAIRNAECIKIVEEAIKALKLEIKNRKRIAIAKKFHDIVDKKFKQG